ncbi:MAG: prepilin peptidase [Oscillospiraceae bacterium]|nr:prepilin peptidase [Oscillospiraceae bacterium]
MTYINMLINSAALIYGGVTDFKRREIPNIVPIVLFASGLLCWDTILYRLIAMLIIAGVLVLSTKLTKSELPGGDFKLLCALTFSAGVTATMSSMLITDVAAIAVALIMKEKLSRHIPLCSYICPAYILSAILQLILIDL